MFSILHYTALFLGKYQLSDVLCGLYSYTHSLALNIAISCSASPGSAHIGNLIDFLKAILPIVSVITAGYLGKIAISRKLKYDLQSYLLNQRLKNQNRVVKRCTGLLSSLENYFSKDPPILDESDVNSIAEVVKTIESSTSLCISDIANNGYYLSKITSSVSELRKKEKERQSYAHGESRPSPSIDTLTAKYVEPVYNNISRIRQIAQSYIPFPSNKEINEPPRAQDNFSNRLRGLVAARTRTAPIVQDIGIRYSIRDQDLVAIYTAFMVLNSSTVTEALYRAFDNSSVPVVMSLCHAELYVPIQLGTGIRDFFDEEIRLHLAGYITERKTTGEEVEHVVTAQYCTYRRFIGIPADIKLEMINDISHILMNTSEHIMEIQMLTRSTTGSIRLQYSRQDCQNAFRIRENAIHQYVKQLGVRE